MKKSKNTTIEVQGTAITIVSRELLVLANLEGTNAELIHMRLS